MAVKAEPVLKMVATTTPRHVTTIISESSKVPVDRQESSQVSADLPVSSHLS